MLAGDNIIIDATTSVINGVFSTVTGALVPTVRYVNAADGVSSNVNPSRFVLLRDTQFPSHLTWKGVSGTWDTVSTNKPWTNTNNVDSAYVDGDAVTFGNINANNVVTISGTVNPESITITNVANSYTFTAGTISGTGKLTKTGAGNVVLKSANTFTGGFSAAATSVEDWGNGMGAGALTLDTVALVFTNASSGYSGAVALTGTSTFQTDKAVTFSGAISGAGGFTKNGTAVLTLSSGVASTFAGKVSIFDGPLAFTNANQLGTNAVLGRGGNERGNSGSAAL